MILLDTNIVLWLAFEPQQISKNAARAIGEARQKSEVLAISGMTLLELATLWTKRRIHLNIDFESFLQDVEKHFAVLPITARACARIPTLPSNYPNDPADRMIGATALADVLPLVTADREIRRAKAFPTIW